MPLANDTPAPQPPKQPVIPVKSPVYGPVAPPKPVVYGPVAPVAPPAKPVVYGPTQPKVYGPVAPQPSSEGPRYGSTAAAENGMAGNASRPSTTMNMAQAQHIEDDGPLVYRSPSAVARSFDDLKDKQKVAGSGGTPGSVNANEGGGVLPINHDGNKGGKQEDGRGGKNSQGGVTLNNDGKGVNGGLGSLSINHGGGQQGGGNGGKKNNDFGGSTAVVVGSNGSTGLSDIQKVRKFSFQIEKAEGKLGTLAGQENQIRQQMAGATDPTQKMQLARQLGSVQEQQQTVKARLERKETRLNNVQSRMASAGTTDQLNQGVKAVAIGQNDNKNGNGPKNGGGQGNNQAQGGIGTKLVNVGGPDAGRPQAANLTQPNRNNNGGNALVGVGGPDTGRPHAVVTGGGGQRGDKQGGKPAGFVNVGGPDAGRPQVGAAGQFDNGAVKPHVELSGIGGPDAGRPQAVALGNGGGGGNGNRGNGNGGGNQGNGNGNGGGDGNRAGQGGGNALAGGGNGGRPQAVALGNGGGNGGGDGNGNKKDNDGPKLMGGPVGGGNNNDSLPTNPPKLVSLGGGGGGTGGGGKFGKKR